MRVPREPAVKKPTEQIPGVNRAAKRINVHGWRAGGPGTRDFGSRGLVTPQKSAYAQPTTSERLRHLS
jgi:hypothetical protein